MENKNVVLSDDELKDVTGGAAMRIDCGMFDTKELCVKHNPRCSWVSDSCVEQAGKVNRSL